MLKPFAPKKEFSGRPKLHSIEPQVVVSEDNIKPARDNDIQSLATECDEPQIALINPSAHPEDEELDIIHPLVLPESHNNLIAGAANDEILETDNLENMFGIQGPTEFVDRANVGFDDITRKQHLSEAFFGTLRLQSQLSQFQQPLPSAIARRDSIDVTIILDDIAKSNIFNVDDKNHNAFHICSMFPDVEILTILVNHMQNQIKDITTATITDLKKQTTKYSQSLINSGVTSSLTRQAVLEWFELEISNTLRQQEFEFEVPGIACMCMSNPNCQDISTRVLSSVDINGNTALHVAALQGASVPFVNLLCVGQRGKFSSVKVDSNTTQQLPNHKTLPNLFSSRCLYDRSTGAMVVSLTDTSKGSTSTSIAGQGIGQLSHPNDLNNSTIHAGEPQSNFEIIIPWILRNMLRLCPRHRVSSSASTGSDSGHAARHDILAQAHAMDWLNLSLHSLDPSSEYEDSGILLAPELKVVLSRLGIRATNEVIRELCRRYAPNFAAIDRKWKDLQTRIDLHLEKKKQREREQSESAADCKSSDRGSPTIMMQGPGSKNYSGESKVHEIADSKNSSTGARAASKSDSMSPKSAPAASKSSRGIDTDTDDATDKSCSKSSKMSSSRSKMKVEDNYLDYIQLLPDDMDYALQIDALIDDIRSGKGLKSIVRESDSITTHNNSKMELSNTVVNNNSKFATLQQIYQLRKRLINQVDAFGRTPLIIAAALGNQPLVEYFLNQGADISITTHHGYNAINLAKSKALQNYLQLRLVAWLNNQAPLSENANGNAQSTSRSAIFNELQSQVKVLQKQHWAYSRSTLSWAVFNGLVDSVVSILRSGEADPNCQDLFGRSPLHECAAAARLAKTSAGVQSYVLIAEHLIAAGADVLAVSISGRNALHELFCKNQDDRVDPNTNRDCRSSQSGLISSSALNGIDSRLRIMTRSLVQWGVNPLQLDRHGMCPLHYCARDDMAACLLELLLSGTVDASAPATDGSTALHFACSCGSVRTAHLLCRWDADRPVNQSMLSKANARGKLAAQLLTKASHSWCLDTLWSACRAGSVHRTKEWIVRMQLAKTSQWQVGSGTGSGGGSHEAADESAESKSAIWTLDGLDSKTRLTRWTALHACVIGRSEHIPKKSKTYKPLSTTKATTKLLLPSLSSSGAVDHLGVLNTLIQSFAFVDAVDLQCRTALMYAAALRWPEACTALLDAGGQVDSQDLDGNTALHFAYIFGAAPCASVLEARGAQDQLQNHLGKSPLESAGCFRKIRDFYS